MAVWKTMVRTTVLSLSLSWVGMAGADSYHQLFTQAMAAFDQNYQESWMFIEERTADGITTVGRYDPRLRERWSLLSVEGRDPSKAEVSEFLERKANESRRNEDDDQNSRRVSMGPDSMVTEGSLTLVEETDDFWLFEFQPRGEGDNADFMRFMDGGMKILKNGPTLSYIDISNNDEFKPRFGFKVKEFRTRMEFGQPDRSSPLLLKQMLFRIDAKAMGLMSVDQTVMLEYRDYQYVGS